MTKGNFYLECESDLALGNLLIQFSMLLDLTKINHMIVSK